MLTDFFVATEAELCHCFPDWFLLTGGRVSRRARSPFTGEIRDVMDWEKGSLAVPGRRAARPWAIDRFPHLRWKNVDPVKLATLYSLLTGIEYPHAIEAMCKPALIAPDDVESKLTRLPDAFCYALATLNNIETLAAQWAQTEEIVIDGWQSHEATDTINNLRKLAREAVGQQKAIYLLV